MNSADLTEKDIEELKERLAATEERAAVAEDRLKVAQQSLQASVQETERRLRKADERVRKAEQRAEEAEAKLQAVGSDPAANRAARAEEALKRAQHEMVALVQGAREWDEVLMAQLQRAQERAREADGLEAQVAELEQALARTRTENEEALAALRAELEDFHRQLEQATDQQGAAFETIQLEQELMELRAENDRLRHQADPDQATRISALEAKVELWKQNFVEAERRADAAEEKFARKARAAEPVTAPGTPDEELQRLAYQDRLTSLPNQNILDRFLDMTVRQVHNGECTSALLVIDLDRFRTINQTMGWEAANRLLVQVGQRLQKVVGDSVGFGRRGEDEFLVVLPVPLQRDQTLGPDNANVRGRNLAHRILEALKQPFTVQDAPAYVTASIGMSLFPGDADTGAEMLEHAQAAMMEAKDRGRNQFCLFTAELQDRLEEELGLELELRAALERSQLEFLWQPIVSIERGRLVGASQVIRWNHPLHGPMPFHSFLDTAERTGLSVSITQLAVREACELARKLRSLPVTVPLTPRALRQAGITQTILNTVKDSRARADQLIVEISHDTPAGDPERTLQVLTDLSHWGVATAVAGLGPGYFALSQLRSAPVHYLRTDEAVMKGVPHDEDAASVCRAALAIARSLDLSIIISGADTHHQARFLQAQGADLACGAFFGQALPGNEFVNLKRQTWSI